MRRRQRSGSPRARATRRGLALTAALALLAGCAEPVGPADPWSRGARLVARTAALARVLARLEAAGETRLARRAGQLRASLPDCEALESEAASADLGALLSALRCRPPLTAADVPWRAAGAGDLAFALPLPGAAVDGARLRGALVVADAGDVELDLELPAQGLDAPRAWLLPGRVPPGPERLSRAGELLHLRVRPDAKLDLASLVSEDGQAARMFRLKSRLFAGLVLDGSWEAAVYPPEPGQRMPRAALALGVRRRDAAVAAMEEFLGELRSSWPVTRASFAVGEADGACLPDLNLLPDLAPCYVATRDALAVGWNAPSLRAALADVDPDAPGEQRAVVELERFARVAPPQRDADEPVGARAPWRRLVARGSRSGDAVRLHVSLEAGDSGA